MKQQSGTVRSETLVRTRRRVKAARAAFPLIQQFGDVELRFDKKRKLDEVVFTKNGECVFHLEYMAGNHVWFSVGDVHVNLYSANSIKAAVIVDDRTRTRETQR